MKDMAYDLDRVIDRKGTHTYKWDNMEHYFGAGGLLPLWVADMDFESPREVKEAIIERAAHGLFGYTFVPDSAYQAVRRWLAARQGWKPGKAALLFMPGVMPSVAFSVQAFTSPGDTIVIQPPVYFPFFSVVKANDRVLAENNLLREEDGTYRMDLADLEDKFRQGAKMLILCSPHNPVGRVWNPEELARLKELCRKYEVILVSDEIHGDLTAPGKTFTPFMAAPGGPYEKTVICTGPTKTFNLPGLSIGCMAIPDSGLRQIFKKFHAGLSLHILNIFSVLAMETAYSEGGPWLDEVLAYIRENIGFARAWLEKNLPKVRFREPEGTYLLWLDFSAFGLDHDEVYRRLIDKGKVGLNNGTSFGEPGRGFFRLNAACPRPILEDGLKRIASAMEGA